MGVGTVMNLCDEDVDYTTSSGCLIASMAYDGAASGFEAPMCSMAITTHTIRGMSSISEPLMLGTLPAGDYSLTVEFNGSGGPAETTFTVEPSSGTLGMVVPEFSLSDDNPLSPTYGESVSPSDFMGQVTGWYFIKAT